MKCLEKLHSALPHPIISLHSLLLLDTKALPPEATEIPAAPILHLTGREASIRTLLNRSRRASRDSVWRLWRPFCWSCLNNWHPVRLNKSIFPASFTSSDCNLMISHYPSTRTGTWLWSKHYGNRDDVLQRTWSSHQCHSLQQAFKNNLSPGYLSRDRWCGLDEISSNQNWNRALNGTATSHQTLPDLPLHLFLARTQCQSVSWPRSWAFVCNHQQIHCIHLKNVWHSPGSGAALLFTRWIQLWSNTPYWEWPIQPCVPGLFTPAWDIRTVLKCLSVNEQLKGTGR